MPNPTDIISVCGACQQASCRVKYPCRESRSAGTVEMTVAELSELDQESPKFWEAQLAARRCRDAARHYSVSLWDRSEEAGTPAETLQAAGFTWLASHYRPPLVAQFYYVDGPDEVPAWMTPCALPGYKEAEVSAKLGLPLERLMVKRYGA